MNPERIQHQAFGLRHPLRAVMKALVRMVGPGFEGGFTGAAL